MPSLVFSDRRHAVLGLFFARAHILKASGHNLYELFVEFHQGPDFQKILGKILSFA